MTPFMSLLLPSGAKNPDFVAEFERGPTFHLTMMPAGGMQMRTFMGAWFGFMYSAIITACCYGFGAWTLAIWYFRKWSTAFKGTFDAILHGLATGAVFMWMWPKG